MNKILEMRKITKEFPGVKALNSVDFSLNKGEIHCLIGANGAGKSTLMKVLAGVYENDSGEIFIEKNQVYIKNPIESMKLGISTIHQELSIVEELTIVENIFLGSYITSAFNFFVNWKEMTKKSEEIFSLLGLEHIDVNKKINMYSMGIKQLTEIAKAINLDSKIIIMDEPTTALSKEEINKLFKVILKLKDDGYSIIYISHKLDELYEIGDRVTVLRNGEHVITDYLSNIPKDNLIEYITGRVIKDTNYSEQLVDMQPFLKVENLSTHKLNDVSIALSKGEILGLYGLVGSGRTELLRGIYGADSIERGQIYMDGKQVIIKSPHDAVKLGVGLVPENRKTEGINLNLSVLNNAMLPAYNRFSKNKFILEKEAIAKFKELKSKLNIKVSNIHQPIKELSGGNQQKVIISKWMLLDSKLYLFDEPTQGIDIGSKDEIYQIMKELSSQDKSILVASSEIDELVNICHRILVMYNGEIVGEFRDVKNKKDEIMNLAVTGT